MSQNLVRLKKELWEIMSNIYKRLLNIKSFESNIKQSILGFKIFSDSN